MQIKTVILFVVLIVATISGTSAFSQKTVTGINEQQSSTNGNIAEVNGRQSISLNLTIKKYEFTLSFPIGADFDLYLYDEEDVLIANSITDNNPEILSYYSNHNQTVIAEVVAFDGTGEFWLNYTESEIPSLEESKFDGKLTLDKNNIGFILDLPAGRHNITITANLETSYFIIRLFDLNGTELAEGNSYVGYYGSNNIDYVTSLNSSYFLQVDGNSNEGLFSLYVHSSEVPMLDNSGYSGVISEDETKLFMIKATDGLYNFSYFADQSLSLALYSQDMVYLTSNYYAHDVIYRNYITQTILLEVEVDSYYFEGSLDFEILLDERLNKPIPKGYTSLQDNYHVYELDNSESLQINIDLNIVGEDQQIAILDESLGLSIENAILYEANTNDNPHSLYNSLYENDNSGNLSISLQVDQVELYLIVFSIAKIQGDDYNLTTGYSLNVSVPFERIESTNNYLELLDPIASGNIYDNGDQYWNDGEFVIYEDFELDAGEIFDAYIKATPNDDTSYYYDTPNVVVLFFDGNSVEEINAVFTSLSNYYEYGYDFPSNLYAGIFSNNETYLSYRADEAMSLNVAIFSYDYYGESFSFDLYANHDFSGSIYTVAPGDDNNQYGTGDDLGTNMIWMWVVTGVLIVGIIRKSNRKF